MKKPCQITSSKQNTILQEAASNRKMIVLTCKTPDGWLTFKSHFVSDISEDGSLLTAYPVSSDYPTPEIVEGQEVSISFRRGHKKFLFSTIVAKRYQNQSHIMPILKLKPPTSIYEHQRRLYKRVPAPKGLKFTADIWINYPISKEPQDPHIHHGIIADLSAGGTSVIIPSEQKPHCKIGTPAVCSFRVGIGKPPVIADAQFRYWDERDDGYGQIGLQFAGLGATQEGRAKLERILLMINQFRQLGHRPINSHL